MVRGARPRLGRFVCALLGLAVGAPAPAAGPRPVGSAVRATQAAAEQWGGRIDALVARGSLSLRGVQNDPDFPGRRHLRYDQRVGGVRVFGAQLAREVDAQGRTLSVFGRLYEDLAVDPVPALRADQAARLAEGETGRGALAVGEPELVGVPLREPARLAWMLWVRFDHRLERFFIDAHSGEVAWRYQDLPSEAAVGLGTGVWGDRKKVSVDSGPDGFAADDKLRPTALTTYDLKFDLGAASLTFDTGAVDPRLVARSRDNDWSDGAVVDAHAQAGWTYDYYFKRHGRRGIDDRGLPVRSLTHFLPRALGFANAFWDPFLNAVFYGDGDGRVAAFSGALDVVAHELTHGVTQYSWDGIYEGESGALNEAFSDIMATAVEFYQQPAGPGRLHADYFLGEDLPFVYDPPRTASRSMEDPGLFCSDELGSCDPDHYSLLYRGPLDSGGVHHNSGIANQAFFLLAEGGANRTSGIRVAGLGLGGREKAEKIFYRGFTAYLTPSATFADARAATLQAARELFGEASPELAQVAAVWTAVGVE